MNGDGKPDIVVANDCADSSCDTGGSVGVLLGNGDGTFQTAVTYGTGSGAFSVAIADVNGDGNPDLLVANSCEDSTCTSGAVSVLLGNGDGTFQTAVPYGSGGLGALAVAVADVNGDGKPDIVVANDCADSTCVSGSVGVLLGNGDGTFQTAVSYGSGGPSFSVAIADVNGDGKPDLLVALWSCTISDSCDDGGGVGVLLGNGDGTFQTVVAYGSGGLEALAVAVADVNGDGKPDVVVANQFTSNSNYETGALGVLLGNGDGTFQTALSYRSGGYDARGVAVGDVNGDGKPDIVVANGCAEDLCVGNGTWGLLLGNGDGTFQTAVSYGSGGSSDIWVAVADVNGDGKPDVLATNVCISNNNCNNGVVGVVINNSIGATTTALVSSANPSTFGQAVTFTATVASEGFKATPTGSVTFNNGSTPLCTSPLNGGIAMCLAPLLAAGVNPISAIYSGDLNFMASSASLNQTVTQASQTITFTTPAPATAKSGDSFTVAANGGASGNPVIFSVGAGSVCTLSDATYTMTSNTGFCYVVANQAGNSNYAAAPQVTETVTAVPHVTKIAPTVTFTGAPTSAPYLSSFTVATTENSGVTPTIRSTTASICSVSGGIVTMKKGTGTCTVKASWATNDYYLPASLEQSTTATLLGTTSTITDTIPQTTHPLKVEVYFTVTNGMNAVTGNVTVTAAPSGESCTGTVGLGKCLLTFAQAGSQTLTAVYAGNDNNSTSTSASYPLTVQ